MATINPEVSKVLVGASGAGPFALIADLDNYGWTRGRDGTTRRPVFGSATPYIKAGTKTSSYDLSGLYNPADTDGQNVLKAAFKAGTTIALVLLPNGLTGWYELGKVTAYSGTAEREGDYVEVSFTFEGDGVRTTYTPE